MVEVDASLPLTGPDGPLTLLGAFEGRRQLDNSLALMDITVYGRQESWADSPPGWPQACTNTRTMDGPPTWTRPRMARRPPARPVAPAIRRALRQPHRQALLKFINDGVAAKPGRSVPRLPVAFRKIPSNFCLLGLSC